MRTSENFSTARAFAFVAILVCLLAQIVFPLVHGQARDAVTILVICAGALALWSDRIAARGVVRGSAITLTVMAIGLSFEIVGVATGIPFGSYHYATGRIGPAVAGVPWVISIAWFVGVISIWRVSSLLPTKVPRILVATTALVGWDFYLDPQMVAQGLWRWDAPTPALPGLAGIPLTNYAGWALMGVVTFGVLTHLDPGRTPARDATSVLIPGIWFGWTWLGSALAHLAFLSGLAGSVPWGLAGMGLLGVPVCVVLTQARPHLAR